MIKFLNKFLLLVAFLTGLCSIGMEITISRLLAPYFGASIFVWSAVIGVVLLSLSIGYFVGGRLSERKPDVKILLGIILATGIFFIITPWITGPVVSFINAFFLSGAFNKYLFFAAIFLVALVLFGLPMVLLGMASPILVKIYSLSNNKPGEAAGFVFASSTIGSVFGTFIPTLWLIPAFGTRATILIFAFVLIVLGSLSLTFKKAILPGLLLALGVFSFFQADKSNMEKNVLYQGESIYQHLRVIGDQDGTRYLLSNEGIGYESIYNPNMVLSGTFYDYFNLLPNLCVCSGSKKVLVVGLAGATIPRQMKSFFKDSVEIDGVEIDGKVIDLAKKYFDLDELNLNVYEQDGRIFLAQTSKRYDVIIVDAFQNELYIPWTLTTLEFWQLVSSRLEEGGIVAININSDAKDSELLEAVANTQAKVFKNVFLANSSDEHNFMLVASQADLDFSKLAEVADEKLLPQARIMARASRIIFNPDQMVLTDDHAPVEQMTDKMLLKYFGGGN